MNGLDAGHKPDFGIRYEQGPPARELSPPPAALDSASELARRFGRKPRRPSPADWEGSIPPHIGRALRRGLRYALLAGLFGFFVAIAPKPMHRPVPPSSIAPGAITGDPCGSYGPIVSATLLSDVLGAKTYRLVCQGDVVTYATRGT